MALLKKSWRYVVVMLLMATVMPVRAQSEAENVLAIVGSDGNIALYTPDSQTLTAVTEDAVPGLREYAWPTWSNDGQLAFFGFNFERGSSYGMGIFLRSDDGEVERLFTGDNEVFTYAYWSPAACETAPTCRDLAVLYTNGDGVLALRRVRTGTKASVTELSVGGPHYWDWSPDGHYMFWARFGEDLERYDVEAEAVEERFAEQQGLQQAVDWSPVDERLLAAVASQDGASSLIILNGDERQILVEQLQSGVAFAWSPDATQVAYLDITDGALRVLDSTSGSEVAHVADEVLAFLWSPDGTRLAYLTFTAPPGQNGPSAKASFQRNFLLQWHIFELATQTEQLSHGFVPTSEMIYYLTFFDQFAHSHQLWSPDSRYLVYAETLDDGRSLVNLIDTQASTSTPIIAAEGVMGVFNWRVP